MRTFTAQVGPSNASKLSAMALDGATEPLMEDVGEGTVKINDLDRLRRLDADADGSITEDDDEGLQIWIGGEGYPIFDDVEATVAEATGLHTRLIEAKRAYDHANQQYAEAVARVVEVTGSAKAAAEALGVDEADLPALASLPGLESPPMGDSDPAAEF